MSNIRLQGTTSGAITLSAPAVAGDNQITFPPETGEAMIKDPAGNVDVNSINNGPLAGLRNAIINGSFDVWQRGDTFAPAVVNTHCADRWRVSWDGSGSTQDIGRAEFQPGQTQVPGEPRYYLYWNTYVAGVNQTGVDLAQRIEDVRMFAGEQVTLSFWARTITGTETLTNIFLGQNFGTGTNSPSSTVFTQLGSATLTTDWQRVTKTTTLPSISGKTIGDSSNSYLSLIIRLPLNKTFHINIAQVQLEVGPIATPFERRHYALERNMCERYFIRNPIAASASQFSGDVTSGQQYQAVTHFSTRMRSTPTITLTNGGASSFPTTVGTVYANSFGFQEQRTANASARGAFLSSFDADAEL